MKQNIIDFPSPKSDLDALAKAASMLSSGVACGGYIVLYNAQGVVMQVPLGAAVEFLQFISLTK